MYDIYSELTTLRAVFYNSFRVAVRPIGGAAKRILIGYFPSFIGSGSVFVLPRYFF